MQTNLCLTNLSTNKEKVIGMGLQGLLPTRQLKLWHDQWKWWYDQLMVLLYQLNCPDVRLTPTPSKY